MKLTSQRLETAEVPTSDVISRHKILTLANHLVPVKKGNKYSSQYKKNISLVTHLSFSLQSRLDGDAVIFRFENQREQIMILFNRVTSLIF